MQFRFWRLSAVLLIVPLLHGCAAAVIGAAAAGTGGAAMTIFSDRRDSGISEHDDKIAETIIARLGQDAEIPARARVQVYSFNRIVLLAGEAPSRALRNRIVQIARVVPGIRKIYNEIVLANPLAGAAQEYDMQLRISGNAALLTSADVSSSHVQLTVSDRTVYIMGLLTRSEARAAVDVIRNVEGVKKVVPLVEYVRLK
jgi:osmotically-inducible protein OsmY